MYKRADVHIGSFVGVVDGEIHRPPNDVLKDKQAAEEYRRLNPVVDSESVGNFVTFSDSAFSYGDMGLDGNVHHYVTFGNASVSSGDMGLDGNVTHYVTFGNASVSSGDLT